MSVRLIESKSLLPNTRGRLRPGFSDKTSGKRQRETLLQCTRRATPPDIKLQAPSLLTDHLVHRGSEESRTYGSAVIAEQMMVFGTGGGSGGVQDSPLCHMEAGAGAGEEAGGGGGKDGECCSAPVVRCLFNYGHA